MWTLEKALIMAGGAAYQCSACGFVSVSLCFVSSSVPAVLPFC